MGVAREVEREDPTEQSQSRPVARNYKLKYFLISEGCFFILLHSTKRRYTTGIITKGAILLEL